MGKQLFKESFQFHFDQVELLEEKTILQEKAGDNKFTCFAVLKRVPVSRYIKNKNGRIYSKILWELLKKQGVAEGTFCLADHPPDDGSVKNIVGIWKNLQLDNNLVYGDLWLVEGGSNWGPLFFNVLKAGGKCGLSSVGYGELDQDQSTVIPESYELVRLGDWVIDPSQSVFATFENLSEEIMESAIPVVEEKTELKEGNLKADETNNTSEIKEEALTESLPDSPNEKKEDIKMSEVNKIQEAHFKNHVKILIREATKNTNLLEGQQTLQDLYKTIPAEMPELKESVEAKLEELAVKLSEQVKEAKTKIEEGAVSEKELKARNATLLEAVNKLKTRNQELKEVNAELAEDRKKMEADLNQFIADRKLMEGDLAKYSSLTKEGREKSKALNENVVKMEKDLTQLAEDRKLMESDISKLVESNKLMEADIAKFEEDRAVMSKDIAQLVSDRKAMLEDIKQLLSDRKLMEADLAKLAQENKSLKESKELEGYDEPDGKDEVTFSHSSTEATGVARIEADLIGKEKSDVAMKLPDPKQSKAKGGVGGMKEEVIGMDKEKEGKEKEEEEEQDELEEAGLVMEKSNFYQTQIKDFFAEEVKKSPALKDFEKEVLASKSLVEAVRKVDQYKSTKVDGKPIKLSEGFTRAQNKPSWLEGSF